MLRLGRILASGKDRRWPVVIIEAGRSKNGFLYTPHVLKEAAPLFERAPAMAFVKLDADGKPLALDHQRDDSKAGKEVLNQVGFYENVRWDDAKQAVVADLVLVEGIGDDYQKHLEALEKAKALDTVGLSINAVGPMPGPSGVVPGISHVTSVDIVSFPAAGGAFEAHRYAASIAPVRAPEVSPMNWFERLKKLCPRLMEGLAAADSTSTIATKVHSRLKEAGEEAQTLSFLLGDISALDQMDKGEAVKKLQACIDFIKSTDGQAAEMKESRTPPAPPAPPAGTDPRVDELQRQLKESRIRESKRNLEAACAARKLPKTAVNRLVEAHRDREDIDEAKADALAKAEQSYLDEHIAGSVGNRMVLRESRERLSDTFVAWISPCFARTEAGKKGLADGRDLHMSLHRFFEAYAGVDIRDLKKGDAARRRMTEAIDATNLDAVYADDLNRALLAEYGGLDRYRVWERIVRQRIVQDFKTYRSITVGYYSELPTVAKGTTYNTLTTPTDRQETIAMTKKGGTEHILIEDLLNDDLGVYQSMISRLARAAQETRHTVVFEQIRIATQKTMSDSNALTAAGRSPANLLTAAFSADTTGIANYFLAVQQMMAQTGGSGKAKGAVPAFIIIPRALMGSYSFLAQQIAGGVSKVDVDVYHRIAGMGLPDAIVDHGTTNTTDWFLLANPNEFPVIDFITLAGQQEPRIVVADDQRFGNLFLKDQQDLVIKDWFAATAVDWVGIQGNDVA